VPKKSAIAVEDYRSSYVVADSNAEVDPSLLITARTPLSGDPGHLTAFELEFA
jgi:hypothetical protein